MKFESHQADQIATLLEQQGYSTRRLYVRTPGAGKVGVDITYTEAKRVAQRVRKGLATVEANWVQGGEKNDWVDDPVNDLFVTVLEAEGDIFL